MPRTAVVGRKRRVLPDEDSDEAPATPATQTQSEAPSKVAKGKKLAAVSTAADAEEKHDDDDDDDVPSSDDEVSTQQQSRSDKAYHKLPIDEQERKVADLARFLLFKGSSGAAIPHAAITDMLGAPEYKAAAGTLLRKATAMLTDIFGYTLTELRVNEKRGEAPVPLADTHKLKSAKLYIMQNTVRHTKALTLIQGHNPVPRNGLVMVVLSLIYMNNGQTAEEQLFAFLKKLGLQREKRHPQFGKIEDYIGDLIKERYLQKVRVMETEGTVHEYRWGAKARAELTEKDIISFVAKVFGDDPQVWMERLGKVVAPAVDGDDE